MSGQTFSVDIHDDDDDSNKDDDDDVVSFW